jgi:hypothetical protein
MGQGLGGRGGGDYHLIPFCRVRSKLGNRPLDRVTPSVDLNAGASARQDYEEPSDERLAEQGSQGVVSPGTAPGLNWLLQETEVIDLEPQFEEENLEHWARHVIGATF